VRPSPTPCTSARDCTGREARRPGASSAATSATRDRLRASRGLKLVRTGQRFLDGFEALRALRGGQIALEALVPGYPSAGAGPHETARAVAAALQTLGAGLTKRAPRRAAGA
jgi:hypothetical protein